MRLTKELAESLLQNAWQNPDNRPWITHCRAVGHAAGVIAGAIGEDADFAEALGMDPKAAKEKFTTKTATKRFKGVTAAK